LPDIEIKRGYEVLPDNNIRFGIRVINNKGSVISDVEVILDYSDDSFKLQGDKIQKLGTIPPSVPRTAKFILQPRGCIHKEELGATVLFKDHEWNRQTVTMRPMEVHCVCPFLKEKSMSRAEFLTLSNSGYSSESGVNFENISSSRVVEFLSHTCKNRLYKVDDFLIDGGMIIYLAGDAVGEKAYYLLTAVVKENEGLTQVFLRANSDKDHGLTGFLNETLDNLRHLVVAGKVREIGIIRKEQVINIIDSVVQRTTFGGGDGGASVNIKDSVVTRTEFKGDEERKKREEERGRAREEKDRLRKLEDQRKEKKLQEQKVEEERQRRRNEEALRIQSEKEEDRLRLEKEAKSSGGGKWFFGVIIILTVLALGWYVTADSGNPQANVNPAPASTPAVTAPQKTTPVVTATPVRTTKATPSASSVVTSSANQNTITNSISMDFLSIPAGEFNMGSPSNEAGRYNNEGPVHQVTISNAFYMGKYEVTQKQWRDVMGTSPSYFKGDNLPVEQVSWTDVQDFIKKLNENEGGNKYRLPTEAELGICSACRNNNEIFLWR
jgi:formylglycine-generating enzyme required for sulfatase activity